jgi:hypothetical protein
MTSFMRFTAHILVLLLALLVSNPATAQDERERPPLPDIAPRTVEIRGALEIFFPALERQPLIGFNPPPGMADVGERSPFVEEYRLGAADLPPSPLQAPSGSSLTGLDGIPRRTGIVETRVGRYLTRHSSARIEHAFTETLAITADVAYDGGDGHRPYDFDPDLRSDFDNLIGKVALHHRWTNSQLTAMIEGSRSNYAMFGASGSTYNPTLQNAPGRDVSDLRGSINYRSNPGPFTLDTRFRIRGAALNTAVCPRDEEDCIDDELVNRDQNGIDLSGSLRLRQTALQPHIGARLSTSGFESSGLVGGDLISSQVDLGLRVVESPAVRLTAGASLLHFSTGENADRPDVTGLYISPDVRLDLYPGGGMEVYLENRPRIDHPYLAEVLRQNPYVTHRPEMMPTVTLVDATGGIRLYRGPATIDVSGGFIDAPFFRYYDHRSGEGFYSVGVFAVEHAHARMIHAGADASLVIGGRSTASLSVRYRDAMLVDEDERVPNLGRILARAGMSIPMFDGRLLGQAGLRFESARYHDLAETRKVGDYFDIDLRAMYRLNPMISIVGSLENVSAGHLEQWSRYPQAPLVFTGGLQITW